MDYITTTLSNINLEELMEERFDKALPYYILQINPTTKKLIEVYIDINDLEEYTGFFSTREEKSFANLS